MINAVAATSASSASEPLLPVEVMRYQVFLVALVALLIIPKTSTGTVLMSLFFAAAVFLASISTLGRTKCASLAITLVSYSNSALEQLNRLVTDEKSR